MGDGTWDPEVQLLTAVTGEVLGRRYPGQDTQRSETTRTIPRQAIAISRGLRGVGSAYEEGYLLGAAGCPR